MSEFSVELVSITSGAGKLAGKTAQEVITHNARVSNPTNQMNFDTAAGLLRHCIKEGHWSIFDQADMGLEIVTSRAISPQFLRHWSFDFQEFSQRYAKVTNNIIYQPRRQDVKNRQNSVDDLPEHTINYFIQAQKEAWDFAYAKYENALNLGVAKECARILLPSSAQTTFYMKGTARNWIHYLKTRTHAATQKEHRDIALACKVIFDEQFPDIAKALFL